MFRLSAAKHSRVFSNALFTFSKRSVETNANLYQSHQEEVIFSKPISSSHPSFNVAPNFERKALIMKNASPGEISMVDSWGEAINSELVRANITERWGLRSLSSIQKAILSTMKERVAKATPAIESGSQLDDRALHVKLMLDPTNSKLQSMLKAREDRENLVHLNNTENLEMVIREMSANLTSNNDFYIQASDHSGKLTAVLSVIADELLTAQPNLSPCVNEAPEVDTYKIFQDREKSHPSAIIVTFNEEESMHVYRLAQRVFARSNASVQWARYDPYASDFLNKAFTLGANVLVLDYLTFHKAVNRGWISSTELKYIVVDDAHKISNRKNVIESYFETLFIQSSWLGQATKRVVVAGNNAYHTNRLAKTVLRDGFVSLMVDEVEYVKPNFYHLELSDPRSSLSAIPSNSIIVVEDINAAIQLYHLFEQVELYDTTVSNGRNVDQLAQLLSRGKFNHLIVPRIDIEHIVTPFLNNIEITFYNTLNDEIFSRLNRLNTTPQKVNVLLGETVTPKGLRDIQEYCDLLGIELDSRFDKINDDVYTSHNFVKNFKVLNFIDAERMIAQLRNPGKEIDISDVPEPVFLDFERAVHRRAMESERNARLEKLHAHYSGEVNKMFRKTPEFRQFYNLQFLNNLDKEQYKYLKKVTFAIPQYTVGDILETLESFDVEWKSPAVTLHHNILQLKNSIDHAPPNLNLSALKHFYKLRQFEPKSALLQVNYYLSIYFDIIGENRVENFFTLLDDPDVKKALSSIPDSDYRKWYSNLSNETVSKLEDLRTVIHVLERGIIIPSAKPIPTQNSEEIQDQLNELTSSEEYYREWYDANQRAIEEISTKLPIREVESFDAKEREALRNQMATLIEREIKKYPILVQERELETALVESLYEQHTYNF